MVLALKRDTEWSANDGLTYHREYLKLTIVTSRKENEITKVHFSWLDKILSEMIKKKEKRYEICIDEKRSLLFMADISTIFIVTWDSMTSVISISPFNNFLLAIPFSETDRQRNNDERARERSDREKQREKRKGKKW